MPTDATAPASAAPPGSRQPELSAPAFESAATSGSGALGAGSESAERSPPCAAALVLPPVAAAGAAVGAVAGLCAAVLVGAVALPTAALVVARVARPRALARRVGVIVAVGALGASVRSGRRLDGGRRRLGCGAAVVLGGGRLAALDRHDDRAAALATG